MHIVDILNVYLIVYISYRSTYVSICLTLHMIKKFFLNLDSNDYFRLKQLSTAGFHLWGASVLTVYLCLYYNIQQQYILFPSFFSIKHLDRPCKHKNDSQAIFFITETPPEVRQSKFSYRFYRCIQMSKTCYCITFSYSAIISFSNTFHTIVMTDFNIRFTFFLRFIAIRYLPRRSRLFFLSFFNVGSSE